MKLNIVVYYSIFLVVFISSGSKCQQFLPSTVCPQSCTCYTDSTTLTIQSCTQSQNSFSLPAPSSSSLLSNIQSIVLRNANLLRFPSNLCLYPNLVNLDLSANSISDPISNTTFSCLTNLNLLNVSRNLIPSIDVNSFSLNTKINGLDLSYNRLISLPTYAFIPPNLPLLKNLYLQHNQLTSIDVWFFFMPSVNYIFLNNNKITQFSNVIGWTPTNNATLTQLYSASLIDLSNNLITNFDDSVLTSYSICTSTSLQYFLNLLSVVNLAQNPLSCTCTSYNLLMFFSSISQPNGINLAGNLYKSALCSTPSAYFQKSAFSFQNPNNCSSGYQPLVVKCQSLNINISDSINTPQFLKSFPSQNQPVFTGLTGAQMAGIVLGFVGAFFLMIALIYCICPIEVLAVLFGCCPWFYRVCPCKSGVVSNKYYDVFVSYNRSSNNWIKYKLVPFFMEKRPNDRFYLQHDEENKDKGSFGPYTKTKMENSACILLILSDKYLVKEWTNQEFRDYLRSLITKVTKNPYEKVRVICIQLSDVCDEEVDDYVRTQLQIPTFLSLENDEFLFWKKLEYFLYINKERDPLVTPIQPKLADDDSPRSSEDGYANEQYLLDEYSTSLEQVVYEKTPSYKNERIQDIKYDHLNKKFNITTGNIKLQDGDEEEQEPNLINSENKKKKNIKRILQIENEKIYDSHELPSYQINSSRSNRSNSSKRDNSGNRDGSKTRKISHKDSVKRSNNSGIFKDSLHLTYQ